MKHPLKTTFILLALFLATQLLGLVLVAQTINVITTEQGDQIALPPQTTVGPPPEISAGQALITILIGVIIGTGLILILARFRRYGMWKIWFFIASAITMSVSIGTILGEQLYTMSVLISFALSYWKVFKRNPYVHNFTELLIYPGIAILFYHILNIPIMLLLLAIISIYDIIAVFKSKHMVSLAEFQKSSEVFAGLAIPRNGPRSSTENHLQEKHLKFSKKLSHTPDSHKSTTHKGTTKTIEHSLLKTTRKQKTHSKQISTRSANLALLGGGDVAFPLLFASIILKELVLGGVSKPIAILILLPVPILATAILALLFFSAQKEKYYPAMPAVSFGAISGWFITLALQWMFL